MKVDLIDRMGDDLTVVNAARVSFNKESDWACPEFGPNRLKILTEKDEKLIKYLAKNGHWTPFSHVQIQMRETVPIFVARQRFKHGVGFTYNEISGRYTSEAPSFYEPGIWRGTPIGGAKQGSSGYAPNQEFWKDRVARHNMECSNLYEAMIEDGVAPEQARMVLPTSTYTSYYVTGSLAAWSRAYKLRSAPDAQKEIQDLAKQWDEIISGIPELKYSWQALTQRV